jgi:hypothetical protein
MLEVVLRCASESDSWKKNDVRKVLADIANLEDYLPTFIDRYIEQGRQQGLFIGRQKGQAELLLRLMTRKFGPLSKKHRRFIERADGDTLLRWSEQVLFATTPDEALR